MRKGIFYFLLGSIFFTSIAFAQSFPAAPTFHFDNSGNITQLTTNTPIKITGLTPGGCVQLTSGNIATTTGTPCGSGSGSGGVATSSLFATYPLIVTPTSAAITFSTAFSTTTNNTFSGTNIFNSNVGISTSTPDALLSLFGSTGLTENPDVPADEFRLGGRLGVTIPVPYLTPAQNNQNIAFDIFPRGAPSNGFGSSIFGVAWSDICSTDVAADGNNYECLHFGKSANGYANVSTEASGSGVVRNLELQANGGNVGVATNTPGTLLSVQGVANFGTATSTFYSSGGINLTAGCFAIGGNCLTQNSGTVTSITATSPLTGGAITTSGSIGIQAASGSQNGYISASDFSLLHTATSTFSSPLVWTAGTNAVTCPTCLTGNQTITLSGDESGSGATAITTSFNLGNTHWWTARQNFTNATSSQFEATSTAWFDGGFFAFASSTIGNGTTAGGLTINGGATTTSLVFNPATAGTLTEASSTGLVSPTQGIYPQVTGTTQARYYGGGYSNGVALTNSTVSANTVYALPIFIPKAVYAINIETDMEGTNSCTGISFHMAIYSDNGNGLPGNLLVDPGNVNTQGLGTHGLSIDQFLAPGQYWLAVNYSCGVLVKAYPVNGLIPTLGSPGTIAAGSTNTGAVTMSSTFSTTTMPSSFTSSPGYPSSPPFPYVAIELE